MGDYKKQNGTTRVGDALRSLGDVAKPILEAAGGLTGQAWLSKVAEGITTSNDIREEQRNYLFELHKMDLADIASARNANVEVQKTPNASWMAKNTIYMLSFFISVMTSGVVIGLFAVEIPEGNKETIYMVLGIVIAAFTNMMQFFFGSSKGSMEKTNIISNGKAKK